jgi:hypothetical protein
MSITMAFVIISASCVACLFAREVVQDSSPKAVKLRNNSRLDNVETTANYHPHITVGFASLINALLVWAVMPYHIRSLILILPIILVGALFSAAITDRLFSQKIK